MAEISCNCEIGDCVHELVPSRWWRDRMSAENAGLREERDLYRDEVAVNLCDCEAADGDPQEHDERCMFRVWFDRRGCIVRTPKPQGDKSMATPHKCPVCGGRGLVPNGFYDTNLTGSSTSATPDMCRTCGGNGVLWEYGPVPVPVGRGKVVPSPGEIVEVESDGR